jgi:hypothetical protein
MPNGEIMFLLRLNFLEGQKRSKGLWKEFRPYQIYVLPRRPSFTGDQKTDATAYMLACWGKENKLDTTYLSWLEWNYDQNL